MGNQTSNLIDISSKLSQHSIRSRKKASFISNSKRFSGVFYFFFGKMWPCCSTVKKFLKKMSSSTSSPSQLQTLGAFFQAYRRLNLFLMFIGICPFLQCKRTNHFICHKKYLQIICIITIIYLTFVIYLNLNELPKLFHTEPNLLNILKSLQFFGTSYFRFFVIISMLRKRQSHADYFNRLYQFDDTYDELIEPPIKYKHMNRIFWIELFAYTVYILIKCYLQYVSHMYLFESDSVAFRMNIYFEQFMYAVILFYMKNCAHNLIVRIRKVNSLLYKFLTNSMQHNDAAVYSDFQLEKLEKIAFMLNILLNARNHLQITFGSTFVLLFTFNSLGIAFNAYQMFESNGDEETTQETNNDENVYFIGAIFFAITIPPVCIFFSSMLHYHVLGNSVKTLFVFLLLSKDQFCLCCFSE